MDKLSIVKVGGKVIGNEESLEHLLEAFAQLQGPKVLVHGGGNLASEIGERLGIKAQMIEGRRVTDEKTLEVVTMVYGGLVNKRLVARLHTLGCMSVGLTGADGNVITSKIRPVEEGKDYGLVGEPVAVNNPFIKSLLAQNITPVVAPLTHDGEGQLFNTNADTIANALASALSRDFEVDLVFAFELDGVMKDLNDPKSLIKEITSSTFAEMKAAGTVADGIIPKLESAFESLDKGASSVKIIRFDTLSQLNDPHFNTYTNIIR